MLGPGAGQLPSNQTFTCLKERMGGREVGFQAVVGPWEALQVAACPSSGLLSLLQAEDAVLPRLALVKVLVTLLPEPAPVH